MGLNPSYVGVDLNPSREDNIFESLGFFNDETSFEPSQGSNVFCQTQFNDIGFGPSPLDMLTSQPELVAPVGDQHSSGSCMSNAGISVDEMVSILHKKPRCQNCRLNDNPPDGLEYAFRKRLQHVSSNKWRSFRLRSSIHRRWKLSLWNAARIVPGWVQLL